MSRDKVAIQTMNVCLKAGTLLLRNGAETARVEETIERVGRASGMQVVYSFVTPTAIIINLMTEEGSYTRLNRITDGLSIDLTKVSKINELSRRFERGQLSLQEVDEELDQIEREKSEYPLWIRQFCAMVAGGGFTMLSGGGWWDLLPGAICAGMAHFLTERLDPRMPRFLAVSLQSFAVTFLAVLLVKSGFGENFYPINIGGLIPLLPGLAVTNAVRDLMANDLISGLARSAEAFLTSFAIAIGVALVFVWHIGGLSE
ncbi:threonine/serine exporter family protein [Effusibacillus dendaii]|uniref:Membrane protein n=1 Tax=Effusibacillus dendaii TaxID=2743772 RepID=A0A7I8DHT3_9BACL|nr:threonine/serine exporter family protein [Effusibacillus dendaii]BCJ87391.1 membrane protein [Effusibacillus dendaii]